MTEPIRIDALRPKVVSKRHVHWYGIFRTFGHTDRFLEDLRRFVSQRRLADVVCGVRLERRAQGEFYFALTYATETPGVLPDDVSEAMDEVPLFKGAIGPVLDPSELKKLFSNEVDVTALGHCLAYRQMKQEAADDPFRPLLESTPTDEAADPSAERLLWYLSAVGAGRWATFRTSCAALGHDAIGAAARLARHLRLLGHLEVSHDGEHWGVTPPLTVVAPTPDGDEVRFATGARLPDAQGSRHAQRHAPDRLTDPLDLAEGALVEDPSSSLSAGLPHVSAFAASLPAVGGVAPTAQRIARHDGATFLPVAFDGRPGLYEVTSSGDRTTTLFFDGTSWRRGDWYGLRYLALRAEGALLPFRYDPATWRLAVPLDQRPPEAFERPLVLASGLLPRRDDAWWVYGNVPQAVAKRLAERLDAPLHEDRP